MMMPVMTLLPGVKGEEAAGQRAAGASLCGRNSVKKEGKKRKVRVGTSPVRAGGAAQDLAKCSDAAKRNSGRTE